MFNWYNIAFSRKRDLKTKDLVLIKGLAAELYYISSEQLFCVIVNDENIQIQEFEFRNDCFHKTQLRPFEKKDFENWCYTIAVNYSHYALNSNTLGPWVEKLFHKNDAYQTPIVINPMRTVGNIDINQENDFVISRLLANLFSPVQADDIGIRQITEQQEAIEVEFERIADKNKILFYRKISRTKTEEIEFNRLKTKRAFIDKKITKVFKLPKTENNLKSIAYRETKKYIVRKLVRIAVTYSHYFEFFDQKQLKFDELKFERYLTLLNDDPSHITYKLKQAINYLKYSDLWSRNESFKLDISLDSDRLDNYISTIIKPGVLEIDLIELLPPPIFRAKIILKDKIEKKSEFEGLSSGEKQLIHSISSILYHIKNVDSINLKSGKLLGYRNINILLDEIELYYHPEMQRNYLAYLLKMISRLLFSKIEAINICLITHSPYILSDIPDYFTLKIDKGVPQEDDYKTFGSNIHDLLANDFFMREGFMGEWAKMTIEKTIHFLNYKDLQSKLEKLNNTNLNEDEQNIKKAMELELENFTVDFSMDFEFHLKIIELIGEPIIRNKLKDMFSDVFQKETKERIAKKRINEIAAAAGLTVEIK